MKPTSATGTQSQSPTPILCASPKRRAWQPLAGPIAALLLVAPVFAGSDTWKAAPPTSIWNAAGNWVGGSVPNGAGNVATFGTSSKLSLSLTANTQVDGLTFNAGADAFTFTPIQNRTLTIDGAGIVNNSANLQTFEAAVNASGHGTFVFNNSATAGTNVAFNVRGGVDTTVPANPGGKIQFNDTSSAGSGIFTLGGPAKAGAQGGLVEFHNSSTAANGTFDVGTSAFNVQIPGSVFFYDTSTLGNANFHLAGGTVDLGNGAFVVVGNSATGGTSVITNDGGHAGGTNGAFGGTVIFTQTTNAGMTTVTNNGGTTGNAQGGVTQFFATASAGSGTFFNNPGATATALPGTVEFYATTTANNGTFINNGAAVSGAKGGITKFFDTTTVDLGSFTNNGGTASGANGGTTNFNNTATAGHGTFTNNPGTVSGAFGGSTNFFNSATAGSGMFTSNGSTVSGAYGGSTIFNNTATAGSSAFTNNGGTVTGAISGSTEFHNSSTAGSGTFTSNGGTFSGLNGGITAFFDTATAGSGAFTAKGGTAGGAGGGGVEFNNSATAGNGTFKNDGGPVSGGQGGFTAFNNASTAGNGTFVTDGAAVAGALGGVTSFYNTATAGSGRFTTNGGAASGTGGVTEFRDTSTAGSGKFTTNGATTGTGDGGSTQFFDKATAGNGTFTANGGTIPGGGSGLIRLSDSSTAGNGTFTTNGGATGGAIGGLTQFFNTSTAGSGRFTTNGGVSGAGSGVTEFLNTSTAGSATFTTNGGAASGAGGGTTQFTQSSTAGNATLIANGGSAGGSGGVILFFNDSTGGTARVIVNGDGLLNIAGHNAPGLGLGSIEGDGQVFLGGNKLTLGGNNLSTTFSGVISDSGSVIPMAAKPLNKIMLVARGSLTKTGTGTFTLDGMNTYTGDTNIDGGVLAVNGAIASANTYVNAGGMLGGTGHIGGHVWNSGVVKPGNSPGKLTIAGDYTQAGAGTLQIDVAGAQPGQYGVLAVGGKASLAGKLQIVRVGAATLKPGDVLKIMTAVGGVSGVFSSIVNPFAGSSLLGVNVFYEPNDVLLVFAQQSFATLRALTPNQKAVAQTLGPIAADPRAADVIGFLNAQPLQAVPGHLDALGPEELTSVFHIAKSLANIQSANILRHTEDIRSGSAGDTGGRTAPAGGGATGPVGRAGREIAPADESRWGTFILGSGEFTHVGSTTNAAGYNLDTGGVTVGVDYRVNEKFTLGLSFGYMNTSAHLANGGGMDVDGGRFGVYATYHDRGLYLDAAVSGGPNSYRTRRTMPDGTAATGSPDGAELNTIFAAGYDWNFKGITIGPTASFQYTSIELDGFTENGTFAPLNIRKESTNSARTAIGIRATTERKIGGVTVRPEVRAAWQHEFGDTDYSLTSTFATLGGAPFTVSGPKTGRDSLLLTAGFSVQWNERTSIYCYYDGEVGRSNYDSHNVSAGLRYRF